MYHLRFFLSLFLAASNHKRTKIKRNHEALRALHRQRTALHNDGLTKNCVTFVHSFICSLYSRAANCLCFVLRLHSTNLFLFF